MLALWKLLRQERRLRRGGLARRSGAKDLGEGVWVGAGTRVELLVLVLTLRSK